MAKVLTQSKHAKIKSFDEIQEVLEFDRRSGYRIVQCHGVFDLLHPGHLRHFKSAKAQGDKLVVTVTPDRFVNKGPGRPAFNEMLRLESLAAIQDIDYVVLNDSPDAVAAIQRIRPHYYAKGMEYADHKADITGKIAEEVRSVEACGGKILYTDEIVFSSSALINRYVDSAPSEVLQFIDEVKKDYSLDRILEEIESLRNLRVLVLGDAIIDEYQYVEPLGLTGKGHHMVAKCLDKEIFLGGSLIISNHIAQFSDHVTILSAIGKECPYGSFIKTSLNSKVRKNFVYLDETSTLVKKRYVVKDGNTLSKMFETYSGQEKGLSDFQTAGIIHQIKNASQEYDLILVCDFGNGFMNSPLVHEICQSPLFLSVNTQTNSGNRGYNIITKYDRADYISLNEPELRLATHDKTSRIDGLTEDIATVMNASILSITRGIRGIYCYSRDGDSAHIPAFATQSIDRIGAGDAYLSLSTLCFRKNLPLKIGGFIGAIAAAMSVQMIGNQEPIKKSGLLKYLARLMK